MLPLDNGNYEMARKISLLKTYHQNKKTSLLLYSVDFFALSPFIPYLCFISFLCIDLYVFGDDALIS